MKTINILGIMALLVVICAAIMFYFGISKSVYGDDKLNNNSTLYNLTGVFNPVSHEMINDSTSYLLADDFNTDRPDLWQKSSFKGPGHTNFKPEMVFISPSYGDLIILSNIDNRTGGEYQSLNTYGYGKYRASIRACNTQGTTIAFFVYKGPEPEGHNEIDIEIQKINDTQIISLSTYIHGEKNNYKDELSFDPGAAFHEYGFDWYPDRVEFYVDNMDKPVWTSYDEIPSEPCYLEFSNWVLDGHQKRSDLKTETNIMYVDWVRVESL